MSRYLVSVIETYRADSEAEATALIEEAKASGTLVKHSCELKQAKAKGEIVDEWYRVSLSKKFTSEKEPDYQVEVHYTNGAIVFNRGGENVA